eukprot:3147518-Prymnesium_polylepis.1
MQNSHSLLASCTFVRCKFVCNFVTQHASATSVDCGRGGALAVEGNRQGPSRAPSIWISVDHCQFVGNSAEGGTGGAIKFETNQHTVDPESRSLQSSSAQHLRTTGPTLGVPSWWRTAVSPYRAALF